MNSWDGVSGHRAKHLVVQVVRRCTQAAAVFLLMALTFLGLYYNYYGSRTLNDIEHIPGWRGVILAYTSDRMAAVENPKAFLRDYNGNLWSMRFAGIDISDPLAFVETTAATKAIHVPLLISILIPVALAFLLGRLFCSWICPGYLVFELAGKLRKLLETNGTEPAEIRFFRSNKYVLLAVGLAVAAATGLPIFSFFYPPALVSRTVHALIFGTGVAGMLAILCLLIATEVFVSPRWWCRSMCPGGALYGLLGARRALRVKLTRKSCTNCGLCHPVCEMGLDVIAESSGTECDNCGVCIRHCPEKALGFALSLPLVGSSGGAAVGGSRSRKAASGTTANRLA